MDPVSAVVRHVVFIDLASNCTDEDQYGLIDDIRRLGAVIPGVLSMTAGVAINCLSDTQRICLVSDHASMDDLVAYRKHPAHLKVAARVHELMVSVSSADILAAHQPDDPDQLSCHV
jgi:hypothetical protein